MPTSYSSRPRRLARTSAFSALALSTGLGLTAGFGLLGAGTASASPLSFLTGVNVSTVYTETNQVAGNDVIAYRANTDGSLTQIASVPTGGTGTGAGTGSQGGVTLGDNDRLLAVVNPGSNDVSIFAVGHLGGLQLVDKVSSGGVDPISVTINGLWVYALNAGNAQTAPDISGFSLLNPRARSTQPLGSAANTPEEVSFNPAGNFLLVTEKVSNTIDVFPVNPLGFAGPAVTTALPAGTNPYGFSFTPNDYAVVTYAGTGALASLAINHNGTLSQVSDVPDGQLAACWVALTGNGSEGFVANAHSGTVSAYDIAPNGTLTLVNPAVQATVNVGDTDLAVAGNGNLYISDQPSFDGSAIGATGQLSPAIPVVTGLPTGTFGLAATGTSTFGF